MGSRYCLLLVTWKMTQTLMHILGDETRLPATLSKPAGFMVVVATYAVL